MQLNIKGKDFQTLLVLYNQEIGSLNEKLLNGESWENLKSHRRNITELAIAIHKSHGHTVPERVISGNPAEFPQTDGVSQQPAE
jgi:hypothetical protein